MAAPSQSRAILHGLLGALTAFLCLAFFSLAAVAEPDFPALTGRVVDNANILSPADEQVLIETLKQLEDKSSDQLVVVTLPSLQGYPIEDFGYQLGRHWGIGTKELNNGALLIVAPNERKVRIEVGYGLEPILTDALSRVIIDNAILPRFRGGDFPGGIKDGVRDIGLALTGDAAEIEQRAKVRRDADELPIDWFTILFYIAIFLLIMYLSSKGAIVAPGTGRSSRSGSGGGWSSGGGGFSGGGGGFGRLVGQLVVAPRLLHTEICEGGEVVPACIVRVARHCDRDESARGFTEGALKVGRDCGILRKPLSGRRIGRPFHDRTPSPFEIWEFLNRAGLGRTAPDIHEDVTAPGPQQRLQVCAGSFAALVREREIDRQDTVVATFSGEVRRADAACLAPAPLGPLGARNARRRRAPKQPSAARGLNTQRILAARGERRRTAARKAHGLPAGGRKARPEGKGDTACHFGSTRQQRARQADEDRERHGDKGNGGDKGGNKCETQRRCGFAPAPWEKAKRHSSSVGGQARTPPWHCALHCRFQSRRFPP